MAKKATKSVKPQTNIQRFLHGLSGVPRILRIVLAAVLALIITFSVILLIAFVVQMYALIAGLSTIYLDYLFNPTEQAAAVTLFFSVGLGIAHYAWGWWIYVGVSGVKPDVNSSLRWYFIVSGVCLLLTVFVLIFGWIRGSLGPEFQPPAIMLLGWM